MANNSAPAVPGVDGLFEDNGPDRGQWDRPNQEVRRPPVQTARDANGESGEIELRPIVGRVLGSVVDLDLQISCGTTSLRLCKLQGRVSIMM